MLLKDALLFKKNDNYFLESLISKNSFSVNEFTANLILSLGSKKIQNLNSEELKIYYKLKKEKLIEEGTSVISINDITNKLTNVSIELTSKCNLNCTHCYLGDKSDSTLNFNKLNELIPEFKELGVYSIDITGGEPFVDSKLFDKLKLLRENDFKISLTSNGTLISDEFSKKVSDLKLSQISITLAGFKEEHEKIYGVNTFEKTINGISSLINQNINTVVNLIVYPDNFYVLNSNKFMNYLNNIGINEVVPFSIIEKGNAIKNKDLLLNSKDYSLFFGVKNESNNEFDFFKKGLLCNAQKDSIFIKSNGDVLPCHMFIDFVIGNIYKSPIKECISGDKTISEFDYSNLEDCLDCEVFDNCLGGCRGRAHSLTNELYSKDKYSCWGYKHGI